MNSKILALCLLFNLLATAQNKLSIKQIDSSLNVANNKVASNPKQTYSIFKELYNESLNQNHEIGVAASLIGMGKTVGYLENYKEALTYINRAELIARKIDNDSLLLYADNVSSIIYNRLGLNAKSLKIIDNCFKRINVLKSENSKNLLLGTLYTNKAIFSENLNKGISDKQRLYLHRKAFYHFSKVKGNFSNPSFNNLGTSFNIINQLDSAKFYFLEGVKFAKLYNRTAEIEFLNLARLNTKLNKINIAKKYLDSSIIISKNKRAYDMLVENYNIYIELYKKQGETKKAIEAQELVYKYKDSAYAFHTNKVAESVDYLLDTMEDEKESLFKKYINYLIALVVTGSIFCFVFGYLYRKMKKLKQDSLRKDNEITVKFDEICILKQKVSTSYSEVIEMAKKNDPLFLPFFKELYPDFYSKLLSIRSDLTLTEQKICFYIKLKFSTKEIADYTFVTAKAIQNRKNKLRKRLNIDSRVDIYDWFEHL